MPLQPPPWLPFSSPLSDQAPLEPFPSFLHCLPPLPYGGLTKSGRPFRHHVLMIDDILNPAWIAGRISY
jgi:hypothetical protein